MKKNEEKENNLKVNKGQLAIKITCAFLAAIMVFSSFATVGYYLFTALAN